MADWGSILYRTPYLVIPRLAIEAMPKNWQDRLQKLLIEADEAGMETPSYFVFRDKSEPGIDPFMRGVKSVGENGFAVFHGRHALGDPWADYRHGNIRKLCPTFIGQP
jgi:hypothetical protein